MADWQIGDLALCVRSGEKTRKGLCYTVSDTKLPGEIRDGSINHFEHMLLRFVQLPPRHKGDWAGAHRFVKVTPPEADAFDREVIDLMAGAPATVEP